MTRLASLVSLLAVVPALAACGDDDGPAPLVDAGRTDAGARDAGTRDAGPTEAGPPGDAGCVENRSCAVPDMPCQEGHERCAGSPACAATGPAAADTPCPGGVCDGLGECLTRETGVLVASDAALLDAFGGAVDMDGDRAIVGMGSPAGGTFGDAAYVYERGAMGWREVARFATGDPTGGTFGVAVSISGDFAAVGSPNASLPRLGSNVGSVYLYQRQADGSWSETQRLEASGAARYGRFGRAVSIDADRLVVGGFSNGELPGDAGAAWVFERSGAVFAEVATLVAGGSAEGDRFGSAVAVDAETVVVGAPGHDEPRLSDAGAAWIFERQSDGSWRETGRLDAGDAAPGDAFGEAVAMDGVRVAVGAPLADLGTARDAGAAYAFELRPGSFVRDGKLMAPDAATEDGFGAVAVSGDRILVGAPRQDRVGRRDTGAAHLFVRRAGWAHAQRIVAGETMTDDRFGASVALAGDRALVGAPGDDHSGQTDAGSVYFFAGLLAP